MKTKTMITMKIWNFTRSALGSRIHPQTKIILICLAWWLRVSENENENVENINVNENEQN